jgi:transcription antitermination factor NusG
MRNELLKNWQSVACTVSCRCIAACVAGRTVVRNWNWPCFPGYVFVRIALRDRLRVLQLPSVVHLVGSPGRPSPLPESEMDGLRQGLSNQVYGEPHPYLKVGRRVRVVHGPLAGAEGILIRKKDRFRVILSIDLIMRSVALEVDAADLEPVR